MMAKRKQGPQLANLGGRLVKFVTHDIRRNPMLGLYFVVGAILVGYLLYFLGLVVRDLTGEKRPAASQPRAQVQRVAPPKPQPKAAKPAPAEPAGEQERKPAAKAGEKQAEASKAATPAAQPAAKMETKPAAAEGGGENWKELHFPDGSALSYPQSWQPQEIEPDNVVLHGVRFRVPGAVASIQCYTRVRLRGDNVVDNLKEVMARQGVADIHERRKKIGDIGAVELSGSLADKRTLITVFDHKPKTYFIASLVAAAPEFERQKPAYEKMLAAFAENEVKTLSLQDIERSIQQGLKRAEHSLIGQMVEITLENGSKHKGVVIDEDDTYYTLENYRYGGRYSFTVRKDQIKKIVR